MTAQTKIIVTLPIPGDHEVKGTTGYFTAREATWVFATGTDRDGNDTYHVSVEIAGPKSRVKSKYPSQSITYLSVPGRKRAPEGGWKPGDVEGLPEWCPRPPMPYSVIEDAHEYAAIIRHRTATTSQEATVVTTPTSHTIDPDRCQAGQLTEPTACTWHTPHHWCDACMGWYGVPHGDDHDAHMLKYVRDGQCACRGHSLRDHHYPKVFRQFAGYAKDHTLEVLHDDGLYRHLRFGKPGTSIGSFHLFTAPGRLWIEGDLGGGWSFTREDDMLRFFNDGRSKPGHINPGYWWEKMPEPLRRAGKGYSEDAFRAYVAGLVNNTVESLGLNPDQRGALERDVDLEVLDVAYSRDEALAALRDFAHGYGLPDGEYRNLTDMTEPGGWEDFDHHFLLACHAIHYGAGRYAREVQAKRLGGGS